MSESGGNTGSLLPLISISWPIEVMVIIAYTMLVVAIWPDRFAMWGQAIAPISMLIGGQAAIAFGGPRLKALTNVSMVRANAALESARRGQGGDNR